MKFYVVMFSILLTGCNLLSDSDSTIPTSTNNLTQTNNGTQTNNNTTIQTNNGTQTNNETLTNQNTTNQNNTNQTTNGGEFEIPFESVLSESRSETGLVAQWKFEDADTSVIVDTSGNMPPMNLIGSATGLTRLPNRNGVVLGVGGKLVADSSSFLFTELTFAEKFTVELWIKTADFAQSGPTRMVTFSQDSGRRNFTLGQDGTKVVTRLRANIDSTGGPGRGNGLGQLESSGNLNLALQHIVWTFDGNTSEVWIDGIRDESQTIPGGLSNWDPTFIFAFGNEIDGNRQWRGELSYAAIYNRPLSAQEIQHHEKLGSEANPTIVQNTDSVKIQDCTTWPFDILSPESFDLFELAGCSATAGSVFVDGGSRMKLSTLSNIEEIQGDLVLNDIEEDNLEALSNLKSIGGNLIVSNNENLTTFLGLSNLESLGGNLIVENNRRAQNTTGFAKLTTLSGNLTVSNNARISSLSGFSNLVTVEGVISIDRNAALKIVQLDGLDSAKRISISYGGVETLSFPALTGVDEFWILSTTFLTAIPSLNANKYYFIGNRALASISQLTTTRDTDLTISYNPALKNLNNVTGTEVSNLTIRTSRFESFGMNNLQRIYGDLVIYNSGIESLDNEFTVLSVVDGSMEITYNYSLKTVDNAFPALENVDILEFSSNDILAKISDGFPSLLVVEDFEATFNDVLPQCDVVLLTGRVTILGTILAHDNDDLTACP